MEDDTFENSGRMVSRSHVFSKEFSYLLQKICRMVIASLILHCFNKIVLSFMKYFSLVF